MVIEKFTFFRDKDSSATSNTFMNINKGSALTLEVTGTATAMQLVVQGIVGDGNDETWTTLGIINATSLAVAQNITAAGIYTVGCEGVVKLRVTINSITGGNVSVVGKLSE